MVKLLLKHGADVNAINNAGEKPLLYTLNNYYMFQFLRQKGATWDSADGPRPMYSLRKYGYIDGTVQELLYKDWLEAVESKKVR